MKKAKLIIISGPSGVGKKTVITKLFEIAKEESIAYSISWTTRRKREDEQRGQDYFFVTREQFEAKIKEGFFLEYAEYAGNLYGTPLPLVEESLNSGKNIILEIEVQGALDILKNNKFLNLTSIFLAPPTIDDLETRLTKRGTDDSESIARRIKNAKWELEQKNYYDEIVVNDDSFEAALKIKEIITRSK